MSAGPDAVLLRGELVELRAQAAAWFDDDDERAALERVTRTLIGSTLIDLARPDTLNLALVRSVAQLPAAWDDARAFAAVAWVCVAGALADSADEAYALRYIGAARDALRMAELVDAPRAYQAQQTAEAATAKRDRHEAELERFAEAWRAAQGKYHAKVIEMAARFKRGASTIERWHAQARAAGLL